MTAPRGPVAATLGLVRGWASESSGACPMLTYLAAHDAFVAWLDSQDTTPAPADVERQLWSLALQAADRGMTSTHWTFVVDGLVAHVNRAERRDELLASYVARGFDLCSRWTTVRIAAATQRADVFQHRTID